MTACTQPLPPSSSKLISVLTGAAIVALFALPAPALAGKAFDKDEVSGRMLLDYLDHPDWRFRLDSTDEIVARRLVQAKPQLEDLAADDPNDRVRAAAFDALNSLGLGVERYILHEILLEAGDKDLRYRMVRVIEQAPVKEDKLALVEALRDPSSHVSRHAARAMVRLGDRSLAPVLRGVALETVDREVAEELNHAASRLGG